MPEPKPRPVFKVISAVGILFAITAAIVGAVVAFGQDRGTLGTLSERSAQHSDVLEIHKHAIADLRVVDAEQEGRIEACESEIETGFARNEADHKALKGDLVYIRDRLDAVFEKVR